MYQIQVFKTEEFSGEQINELNSSFEFLYNCTESYAKEAILTVIHMDSFLLTDIEDKIKAETVLKRLQEKGIRCVIKDDTSKKDSDSLEEVKQEIKKEVKKSIKEFSPLDFLSYLIRLGVFLVGIAAILVYAEPDEYYFLRFDNDMGRYICASKYDLNKFVSRENLPEQEEGLYGDNTIQIGSQYADFIDNIILTSNKYHLWRLRVGNWFTDKEEKQLTKKGYTEKLRTNDEIIFSKRDDEHHGDRLIMLTLNGPSITKIHYLFFGDVQGSGFEPSQNNNINPKANGQTEQNSSEEEDLNKEKNIRQDVISAYHDMLLDNSWSDRQVIADRFCVLDLNYDGILDMAVEADNDTDDLVGAILFYGKDGLVRYNYGELDTLSYISDEGILVFERTRGKAVYTLVSIEPNQETIEELGTYAPEYMTEEEEQGWVAFSRRLEDIKFVEANISNVDKYLTGEGRSTQ